MGEFVVFGATALAAFLALYAGHRYSLGSATVYSAAGMVAKTTDTLILLDRPFPAGKYLDITLSRDFLAWILVLTGFAVATLAVLSRESRRRGIGLMGLGLPLATLVFYRNAFPYSMYLSCLPRRCLRRGSLRSPRNAFGPRRAGSRRCSSY